MSYDSFANAVPTMTYEEQVNLLSVRIDAVKKGIPSNSVEKPELKDHRNSYPEGYFDLFGSDPTFFEEPEELPVGLDGEVNF